MKNGMRVWLMRSTALIVLCTPCLSYAQSTEVQAGHADSAKPASEEIIVTARKVAERAQDVPLSITTLNPETLSKGAQPTVESLSNAAPTLKIFKTVNQTGSYAVYIRGLGRDNNYFNVEAPVAFYVDDVLYPFQVGPVLDIGGIARVEVLRGPQGTLYGRSATVGAVKYYTVRPDLNSEKYSGAATIGSYGRAEVSGGVSIPIVEGKLAVRMDAGYHRYGGYILDQRRGVKVDGTNGFAGRLGINYQPNDDLNIFVSVDGRHDRDEPNIATSYINPTPAPVAPRFGSNYTAETNALDPLANQLDAANATLQIAQNFGGVTLKSITAYHGSRLKFSVDAVARAGVAYSGSYSDVKDRTFSQELQLTGKLWEDRVTFATGLYYLHTNTNAYINQPGLANNPKYLTHQEARTYAAYFDATVRVVGGFSISGGVRYDDDHKNVDQQLVTTITGFSKAGSAGWNAVSPRVGAEFKVNSDILFYGNWSKGYKSGALNSLTPTLIGSAVVFIPPERVKSTEIGIKSQWLDKRITLNADYFWATYANQTSAILDSKNQALLIAADARVEGFELEGRIRPIANWAIGGNLAIMKGRYINIDPLNTTLVNLADKTPKHVPKFTYSINTDYTFNGLFQQGGALTFSAAYNHISRTFECLNHAPVCVSNPYGVLDLSATYSFPDGHSQVVVAGTNVTDTEYFKVATSANSRWYSAPAEYMLTFRYKM